MHLTTEMLIYLVMVLILQYTIVELVNVLYGSDNLFTLSIWIPLLGLVILAVTGYTYALWYLLLSIKYLVLKVLNIKE